MSRNKKFIVIMLALALVASAGLSAQAAAGNTDAKLFCIDIGMATGYSLLNSAPLVGKSFGFNLTVADNFSIGVANIAATRTYRVLRLAYYLTPAVGFDLYVGSANGGVGSGIGAFYNIVKSKSETSFANALKVKLAYLFNSSATDGVDMGDIVLGISTSLGY